jgi:hypothetical protein
MNSRIWEHKPVFLHIKAGRTKDIAANLLVCYGSMTREFGSLKPETRYG